MSDLRDEIARAFIRREWDLGPGDDDWNPAPEELAAADAVLRVVGERLLSDEAVDAAWCAMDDLREKRQTTVVGPDSGQWQTAPRAALSAAWRVVTGSKDGSDQ